MMGEGHGEMQIQANAQQQICDWCQEKWQGFVNGKYGKNPGSDQYPVFIKIHRHSIIRVEERKAKQISNKAEWDHFEYLCEMGNQT